MGFYESVKDGPYFSEVKDNQTINMTGQSYSYTAPQDGYYCIMVETQASGVGSDFWIQIGASQVAHQVYNYTWQRLNAYLLLKAGTVIKFQSSIANGAYGITIVRLG